MTMTNSQRPPSIGNQQGVALIQVIITTAIILLLTIYFLSLAKSQVQRAQALQDKSTAFIEQYGIKNQLLFTLLTKEQSEIRAQGWNYRGEPFTMGHTVVRLQDLNGLFSLTTITRDSLLSALLKQFIPNNQAEPLTGAIMDWIDEDSIRRGNGAEQMDYLNGEMVRNGPMQSFTELMYIKGMTLDIEQALMATSTFQPTGVFNPTTAPERLLAAYLGNSDIASQVHQQRQSANYNDDLVKELTGLSVDEGLDFFVGPGYRLSFDTHIGESYYGRVLEYQITPYWAVPVTLLSQSPREPQ